MQTIRTRRLAVSEVNLRDRVWWRSAWGGWAWAVVVQVNITEDGSYVLWVEENGFAHSPKYFVEDDLLVVGEEQE
jgi:hypothetical protein